MKIYAAQINPCVGDIDGNVAKIISHIKTAKKLGAALAVFPELCITGYPSEDLLLRPAFIADEQAVLKKIAAAADGMAVIIGATYGDLYNAAWLLKGGKAQVVAAKTDLPNYGVFDEKRYFKPGEIAKTFNLGGKKIGVIVCEDMWTAAKTAVYKKQKVDLLVSINASPYEGGKLDERVVVAAKRAREAGAGLVYVNTVGGQDGVVFDGGSFVADKSGKITAMLPQFVEMGELFAGNAKRLGELEEKYRALVLGLRDYVGKNGFKKVLLGLSGGMDSALTAVIAVDALTSKNVRLVVLPTRFTSEQTYKDAYEMCKNLGITPELIDIEPAFKSFEQMLAKNFAGTKTGLAEENIQSRVRGLTLMAIANKHGELLLTTGNKSELATGYATLYGDMCGAFNVLKDLYKTEVYEVAKCLNRTPELRNSGTSEVQKFRSSEVPIIPQGIIDKAPTAELRENQKDEDSLPPYEVLDAILKLLIEGHKSQKEIVKILSKNVIPAQAGILKTKTHAFAGVTELQEIVDKVAKLLYQSEYKRFQAAPGVKLGRMSFGKDWRYPLTNKYNK